MVTQFTSDRVVIFSIQSATSNDFVPLAARAANATWLSVQIIICSFTSLFLKVGAHLRIKPIMIVSQMVYVPIQCTCGQDCKHALRCLQMGRLPFTANQNLSVGCLNMKGIVCILQTGFFLFANCTLVACSFFHFFNMDWSVFVECALKHWFVVCQPRIRGKLIYYVPSAYHTRTAQCNQGVHVCTRLQATSQTVWVTSRCIERTSEPDL